MMSPLLQTTRDKRFLIIPVPSSEENLITEDQTAVVAATDNQKALLARQIRDKIAKQKLLQTAKILCNVLEEPVKTYMSDNMIQNNWVSLPRLEYITEENTVRTKYSSISQSAYTAGGIMSSSL